MNIKTKDKPPNKLLNQWGNQRIVAVFNKGEYSDYLIEERTQDSLGAWGWKTTLDLNWHDVFDAPGGAPIESIYFLCKAMLESQISCDEPS